MDLLEIQDPAGISLPGMEGDVGLGDLFAFPFVMIERVVVLGENEIGVLNDNNFPFSIGRHVGEGQPDGTEFIVIKLGETLGLSVEDTTPPMCGPIEVERTFGKVFAVTSSADDPESGIASVRFASLTNAQGFAGGLGPLRRTTACASIRRRSTSNCTLKR